VRCPKQVQYRTITSIATYLSETGNPSMGAVMSIAIRTEIEAEMKSETKATLGARSGLKRERRHPFPMLPPVSE
jgi:hypothetical protein